jgi:hypothetical protein
MDNYPALDLSVFFDAIEADIKARFPSMVNVEFFPDEPEANTRMPVPAILLDVSEMDVDSEIDPGTEQLPTKLSFSAFIIISGLQDGNTKLQIRMLAAALVSWLKFRHWRDPSNPGTDEEPNYLPSDPAMPLGAYRDDFNPALDRYEVWRVDWEQNVYLGESVFDTSFLPSHVWLGIAPEIGLEHKDKYTEITGNGQ